MAQNKKTNEYFEMFMELGGFANSCAVELEKILKDFDPDALEKNMDALHKIEHAADDKKHTLMKRLAKEFITPIEREDILAMAGELDDIVDGIEDILIKIYMYNIRNIRSECLEFLQVIIQCCNVLDKILHEFPRFRKSQTIHDDIVELNRLENVGDKLHTQAMRALYAQGGDPLEVMAWSAVYSRMEHCCDSCEHAANVVEEVIMKNT